MSEDDLKLTHIPSVEVGMLIRRPPGEVFEALVDPAITTKFWFTKSSGRLEPGAHVEWDWEMYDVSAEVIVKEIEDDRRILIDWGQGDDFTEQRLQGAQDDGESAGGAGEHDVVLTAVRDRFPKGLELEANA